MTPNRHFWTFTRNLCIWKCMNPTLLPCILSGGTYSSTLWAVHPCTQGFELILGRYYLPQTQKTSFFPLFLVSWGRNNNFTTTQSSILWRWDMAHQNLKRKWGVTMLLSELPRLELAKRGKNGIFGTNSNNYTHNIPRHPLGWTWNLKLTPLPIFLTNKIKTFYGKLTQAKKNSNLLKSWLRWKPSWPGGLRPSHQNFGNSVPLSELVGNG